MKKLIHITLLSLTGTLQLTAQNLVLNPSFEEYVPDSINNSDGNSDIAKATHWTNPGPGSPDYFHSDYNFFPNYLKVPENDLGNQVPHTGNAYAGIYTFEIVSTIPNVREYIRTELSSPLQANKNYRVSMYASLADRSNFATIFGANLSATPITNFDGYFMVAPTSMQLQNAITDEQNWTYISWNYVAQGGEKFLTIGGYTYDVDLDTLVVSGPYPNAYYYIDDVSVTMNTVLSIDESDNSSADFSIYPNPVNDVLTLQTNENVSIDQLIVTDAAGRTIKANWSVLAKNMYQLSVSDWSNGVYFISSPDSGSQRFIKK